MKKLAIAILASLALSAPAMAQVPPIPPPIPLPPLPVPPGLPVPPIPVPDPNPPNCRGDNLRSLLLPRLRGERFVSATATLRGRLLPVRGRRVIVDLRQRAEGTYVVRVRAIYAEGSHRRTMRFVSTFRVTCS